MTDYRFSIEEDGEILIACFAGEISTHGYSEFRNDYNEICRQLNQMAIKRLIIDLTETKYFGSLFIGMIVKLSITIRHQQGHLALCGLSDQLEQLMKQLLLLERTSDAANRLQHFATRAEALSALVTNEVI